MQNLLFLTALACLSLVELADGECYQILQETDKLSSTYPERIAHGIHSLTLKDVHYYFNPEANETNNIPTVNRNLSSREPILNDAPDLKPSGHFKTIGLQVAEDVMLSDGDDWDLHNADAIDKLLHGLHMHEMWNSASEVYSVLLDDPTSKLELCPCLMDVENNGIYHNLRNIAMLIREPELGYNKDNKRVPRTGRILSRYYSGTYSIGHAPQRKKREAEDDDEVIMHSGAYWTSLFKGFSDEDMKQTHSDLGLFLYCMLN